MKIINHKVYFNFIEKCINKLQRSKLYNNTFFYFFRQKRLNNLDFTIISNNCWGGLCYEFFGLMKTSPTVGCYFFSSDYIKFISNLKKYLEQELVFITLEESMHKQSLLENGDYNAPIAKLGDIEIIFLHYKNEKEIIEKWKRRCSRINYDNLIIKYSNMNDSSLEDIKSFLDLKIQKGKKLLFLNKDLNLINKDNTEIVILPEFSSEDNILNDTFFWKKYLDIYNLINMTK